MGFQLPTLNWWVDPWFLVAINQSHPPSFPFFRVRGGVLGGVSAAAAAFAAFRWAVNTAGGVEGAWLLGGSQDGVRYVAKNPRLVFVP